MKLKANKWVFMSWPNMALTNMELKIPKWCLIFEGEKTVEREGEKRRREEGRRRRGRASKAKLQKGMELLTLCMDPWFCWLMVYPKPRV